MPRNPSNNSSTLGTEVSIHGSCKGTRGRGGWAAVISDQEQDKYSPATTELQLPRE
ncbi:MAG: hypothetical protein CM1200mP15_12900 [Dehalococcoidia bacterium]|nr:MAG: hypothetical protein CM1200mP15_12900 [Dehalococcoidia bacterium]